MIVMTKNWEDSAEVGTVLRCPTCSYRFGAMVLPPGTLPSQTFTVNSSGTGQLRLFCPRCRRDVTWHLVEVQPN